MRTLIVCILILSIVTGCSGSSVKTNHSGNFYVSAWYATYDAQRGLESFSNHPQIFNEINPVWYNLNPDYFSNGVPPFNQDLRNRNELLAVARSNGIKVLPTIQNFGATNFDPALISAIINNPALRTRHVSEIVNLVTDEAYDGIDIDYENLSAGDRVSFSAFISELNSALEQRGKLLSVTVYTKTSPNAVWDGPGAQDWTSLAANCNTLKVMAYDYHWAGFHAGPISPADWLRDILRYADSIPEARGKVIIGLPFYGLDWVGQAAREVMYEDVIAKWPTYKFNRENVDHSFDPICGKYFENVEPHFEYQKPGENHTVYFQDAESLSQRLAIISQYSNLVKGVTFWHLGGEDPRIWNVLGRYK
jgi:spore germination protein